MTTNKFKLSFSSTDVWASQVMPAGALPTRFGAGEPYSPAPGLSCCVIEAYPYYECQGDIAGKDSSAFELGFSHGLL